MIKFDNNGNKQWSRRLIYTALVIVTVAIIVFFLPRNSGPQFRYDIGKPWMYSSLIAKFDFPIYKTEERIKEEQDSIAEAFEPYYNYNTAVEQEQVKRFLDKYKAGIPGLPPSYVALIADRLHRLYQAGVMNATEYSRISRDTTNMVRVVNGKNATSIEITCLYSTFTAYERLFSDPKIAAQKQLLQRCNLNEYIQANLIYDEERSETELGDILSGIPLASGMVLSGQKIIDRGEIVDDNSYRVLNSFEKETRRRSANVSAVPSTIAGQVLFVGMLIILFTTYLRLFRKEYYNRKGSLSLLFALIMIYCVVTGVMVGRSLFNVYMLPYAMLPVIIRVFLDSRTAFTTHVITILTCSICLRYPHEFILLQVAAGLVAIFSLRELSQRSQLFKTAGLVFLTYAAVYFAFELITENDLSKLNGRMYIYFIINGIFLLFTYPLLFLLEKTFGFTSNVTLVELSNINTPLLRRMSETVPGTFQHSMQVANLAAEAANRIGAKSQLVRTGALYHDIGKMENPVFFTENQRGGLNPHKNLSYEQSAQVVISHVTEGVKLAEKNNLPKVIKDFITTHHGRGKTKYFYISWKNEHPGEEPDEALFTYPGPNPFTKEQAVLMMADAVEAASRSLSEYTEESIGELVDKIIDSQVAEGYFKQCPITFRDIATVKEVFKEKLKTIYHTRISYPELKKQEKNKDSTE